MPPNTPPPAAGLPFSPPKMDKNGVPELSAPGLIMMMTVGPTGPSAHMVGKAQTTAQLAGMVGNELDRPVVDKTGLTAKYDFVLESTPDRLRMMPLLPGVHLPHPRSRTVGGDGQPNRSLRPDHSRRLAAATRPASCIHQSPARHPRHRSRRKSAHRELI